jgi:hypothetical protein
MGRTYGTPDSVIPSGFRIRGYYWVIPLSGTLYFFLLAIMKFADCLGKFYLGLDFLAAFSSSRNEMAATFYGVVAKRRSAFWRKRLSILKRGRNTSISINNVLGTSGNIFLI